MAQQNIYDNEAFFANFQALRSSEVNFNDLIETPILLSMLPDLSGRAVLDIGCGMGQHAKQYADLGAASVLGIDLSENMLRYARAHNAGPAITYRRLALEELGCLEQSFDLITSSLVFDYAADLDAVFRDVAGLMRPEARFVFSMSHPLATAWDGEYPRFTRAASGERLYANLCHYMVEGRRCVPWVVEDYELYHRTLSTIITALLHAGFAIEDCQESRISDALRAQYPDQFGGTIHRPDFVFFRCRTDSSR